MMTTSGQTPKRYDDISPIFELIDTLSDAKKMDLLKNIAPSKLTMILQKLIIEMPDGQRAALLEDLKELSLGKRNHPRKECQMTTDYVHNDRAYRNFVKDISEGGAFVETKVIFEIGEEIVQSFSLSEKQIPFKFTGEVVRSNETGIGIRFEHLSNYQKDVIKALLVNFD
jgi:Tfp pilus assembly protein PilZ